MRVRKVNSDGVKIHDSVQVKLKTAGTTQVIQFTAGNNKSCPVRNLSKDEYLDKKTGKVTQRRNLRIDTSLQRVCEKVLISLWI